VAEPEVAVVIVSYNTREHLLRCLRTVARQGYAVTVVDNASTDGSARVARTRFPSVRVLESPENLGFGAAANCGIEATEEPYVLLLNPDAWPRDDHAIPSLLACARRNPEAGVLGPRLVDLDGMVQPSLVGVPTGWWAGSPALSTAGAGVLTRLALRLPTRGEHFLVGAALLLRRAALTDVEGFDPAFFMFGEEVDLCIRLQRAGWNVHLCPSSVFVHVGGAATSHDWPRLYHEQLRGHLRLLAKHEGTASAERARRYLRIVLGLRALVAAGEKRALYREAASWVASQSLAALLEPPARTRMGRTSASADRTSRSAG
jgi:N-acetylglucosaminyl-diphospho-decaprenol L-rhamnosyltransferase